MAVEEVQEHQGRLLAWIAEFDERSRAFPVRAPREAVVFGSRTWRDAVVLDQGDTGTCVGNGHAGRRAASPALHRDVTEQVARQWYDLCKRIDGEPDPERQLGTSVLSGAKAGKQQGYYTAYRWAFSLDDLIHGVSTEGPAVIGVNWYESMFDPDESGYLSVEGDVVGGHCVLVRGVAMARQHVRIRNSWGNAWGPLGGDARIRWADMERLIEEEAELCFPTEPPA